LPSLFTIYPRCLWSCVSRKMRRGNSLAELRTEDWSITGSPDRFLEGTQSRVQVIRGIWLVPVVHGRHERSATCAQ
jgi:hypothetical protein